MSESDTVGMNDYKGYISKEHTIWCGGCSEWHTEPVQTASRMRKVMRKAGWLFTKAYGWLCPECKKKR